MKRSVIMFLVLILIICVVSTGTFTNAYNEQSGSNTLYSGGSGTEDDPYLISTEEDLAELRSAMATDVSLWYTKYFYKLTNDIETSCDLYVPPSTSYDRSSSLIINCIRPSSFQLADESIRASGLVPIYQHSMGEDIRGGFDECFLIADSKAYFNEHFGYFRGETYLYNTTNTYYYWNAGFTGVFDGDGHTIKMDKEGFFFGFVENEAVIKNLIFEGEEASFAYCIDQTSMVVNCDINVSDKGDAIAYNYGKILDGVTDDGIGYTVDENSFVTVSALTVTDDTVVIPKTINGMPVVSIGSKAFSFREVDIDSLYIHSEIYEIAPDAFGFGSAKIGTIYFNGTEKMLYSAINSSGFYSTYNIEYDYVPIEGFALTGGESVVTLNKGETFWPRYEYYPENGRGVLRYSFEHQDEYESISMNGAVITALREGETKITVTAESGVVYGFTVRVVDDVAISVEKLPSKVNYGLRESFDPSGLKIVKQSSDGTSEECTEYTLSSFNALKKGIQTITVSCDGYETSFNVYVSGATAGDTDLDGAVSSMDSNLLRRIMAGIISVEQYTDGYFVCDLNGDGQINAVDSALLKMKLVGYKLS